MWQSFTTRPHDKIHLLLGSRMCDNHLQPDPMTRSNFYLVLECVTIIYNQSLWQGTPLLGPRICDQCLGTCSSTWVIFHYIYQVQNSYGRVFLLVVIAKLNNATPLCHTRSPHWPYNYIKLQYQNIIGICACEKYKGKGHARHKWDLWHKVGIK